MTIWRHIASGLVAPKKPRLITRRAFLRSAAAAVAAPFVIPSHVREANARLIVNQLAGFNVQESCLPDPTTLYEPTMDDASSSFVNFTIRNVVPPVLTRGEQIRVSITAGSGEGCDIDNVAVGIRSGSTKDTTAVPTEIKFSGGSGVNIGLGATSTSDWTSFSFARNDELLVIIDVSSNAGADQVAGESTEASGAYFVSGNSFDVAVMPGSPSLQVGDCYGTTKVESQC